ncbi:MAG: PHB depolymerase family esterase [Methylibium sp.]|uniref:extracellular catalytic domain type 1 short-chain-length polyhydroxyalkanoate depolymerase n=1 Tax=Methylibium sp. TaxID=2067992 RepID=UPI0017FF7A2F|nr:PHB depolymerase family esterase [Methylibium sp.]MBA3597711.1 PHB depolymerase family esterase [Methylibium sp.]
MNTTLQSMMNEAARLTRSGDLQAATAAIQAALAGSSTFGFTPPGDGNAATQGDKGWVIDMEPVSPRSAPPGEAHTRAPSAELPVGGRFESGRFTEAAGTRDYKLYIPPGAGERALPLVVMLHGCTQNPDDFAAGTGMNEAVLAQGFFVLYPAQSQKVNPQRCWNWFKHSHQQRGRGEPALLAGMTREVMSNQLIDPQRVFVAGLSAGGAMAAILGETYPELFAAVGVHSGLAAGAASDLPSALAAMKGAGAKARGAASGVPTIVFHGDADTTVHPSNGEQVIAASADAAARVEVEQVEGRSGTRRIHRTADGRVVAEHWVVHGAPHAWSGGSARGSYTYGRGPDASAEMLRFFFEHPRRTAH